MTSSDYRKLSVLLSNMKNGSRDAFASIYKMYEKKVYFLFCKIVGSKTTASDMTIDLFDHVYLHLSGLNDPMDFEKWLYTLIFSRARRYLLNNRPEDFGDYFDTDSPAGEEADILLAQDADEMMSYPEGVEVSVDMMKTVDAVLSDMPLKLRVAVLQYYACGFDMTEIAAAEQISVMAVKNRLLKARIRMKTEEHKYTELGYDCVGLVVFLPDILSVMSESIVVAANVASGVTSRTGIRCIANNIPQPAQQQNAVPQITNQPVKSNNFAPTSYAVPAEPKKRFGEDMSPSVKVIMAIVAILIIIGGTVAVVLAVQNRNEAKETGSIANVENTTQPTTMFEITTNPIKTTKPETTTEETTTATTTETTTETTTSATTQTTTETTTAETTTAETTTADVQQPEPDGGNLPEENEGAVG